jgi:hypothetical protein
MGLDEITAARGKLWKKILDSMNRLLRSGCVFHGDILRHYRLNVDYGISSVWHGAVYSREPFLHRRYMLLVKSDAERMEDIPADELLSWRPLRVFSLWNAITWKGAAPEISQHVLSPLEYELLLLCSGKLQVRQVMDLLLEKFKDRFETGEEAERMVFGFLKEFEERNWLVFAPY